MTTSWSQRLTRPWWRLVAATDPRAVYIGLAVVLGLWVVTRHLVEPSERRAAASYDWMLNHRFREPVPDPSIVVVDIDERSLAAMADEHGRWPWPRDVLATVLAGLEAQGASAVVFDILFSDADRGHPVSDRAFAEAVARSRIAYFPVLRLSPANDAKSALRATDFAGLVVARPGAVPTVADAARTLALVPPFFESAIASRRLGTHNVDPDVDGQVRRYRLYEDLGGLRVLSLPARLALDFGWPMPGDDQKLLRFNRQPMAYRTVSFADLYADLLRSERVRPQDEFRDRIVLIGSTAAGLFDLKGTPVARLHPGVDLLATTIDDTRNARFVGELPVAVDILVGLLLVAAMPWLCIRYSHEQLKLAFLVAPGLLFAISYLSLNLTRVFLDLATPASVAFLYFSLAKLYSAQVRRRWGEGEPHAALLASDRAQWAGCLAILLPVPRRRPGFETRYLNLLRMRAPHVRLVSGLDQQSGWLTTAFSGVLLAVWVADADDADAIATARSEAVALLRGLRGLRTDHRAAPHRLLDAIVRDDDGTARSKLRDEAAGRDRLRALIGRTLLAMSERST